MIWTIVTVLVILWLLGVISGTTFGGLVHVLLVIALVMLVINLLQRRRA